MARFNNARCSFCGKHQDQVRRLVAGPGVFICDQCIALCSEIINEPPPSPAGSRGSRGRAGRKDRWLGRLLRSPRQAPAIWTGYSPLGD